MQIELHSGETVDAAHLIESIYKRERRIGSAFCARVKNDAMRRELWRICNEALRVIAYEYDDVVVQAYINGATREFLDNFSLQQKVYDLESSEKALRAQLSTKDLLVQSLREDAARYRWLRKCRPMFGHGSISVVIDDRTQKVLRSHRMIDGEEMDAAIDQARGA